MIKYSVILQKYLTIDLGKRSERVTTTLHVMVSYPKPMPKL